MNGLTRVVLILVGLMFVTQMENDWDSRYEIGGLAICLFLIICVFWVPISLIEGFKNSFGMPRNTSLVGHIRVYLITLCPFLLPGFLVYRILRARP
jgi:hypothetical protein